MIKTQRQNLNNINRFSLELIRVDPHPCLIYMLTVFFFILLHLSLDVGSVEGLAYHRAWGTVYWTSSTTSSISRHTVDQSRHGAFRRQPVVTMSEDDHPHVLALDECQKSVTFCWHFYIPSIMTYYFNNSTTTNNSNKKNAHKITPTFFQS